jgi:condensin complex subunit 1
MDNVIFRKLQHAILHPTRTKEWFSMAEQVINAVYALGEQPAIFCDGVIKKLTVRAFSHQRKDGSQPAETGNVQGPESTQDENAGDVTMDAGDITMQDASQPPQEGGEVDLGEAFELSQLLFVVGHVAIKHIVFLEFVEREWKRQKDEKHAGMLSRPYTQDFAVYSSRFY